MTMANPDPDDNVVSMSVTERVAAVACESTAVAPFGDRDSAATQTPDASPTSLIEPKGWLPEQSEYLNTLHGQRPGPQCPHWAEYKRYTVLGAFFFQWRELWR
jgi:hypothetical protein